MFSASRSAQNPTDGNTPQPFRCDYAAAKAGMVYGLTLSLKNEIIRPAPRGTARLGTDMMGFDRSKGAGGILTGE